MSVRRLFAIDGLWCGGCARGLERHLRMQTGIEQVTIHFLTASALIQWDPVQTSPDAIAKAINQAGYALFECPRPEAISERLEQHIDALSIRLAVALFFGMWSMLASLALYVAHIDEATAWHLALASGILAMPVVVWAGADILRMAVRSLALRSPGIDLLIALGALGAGSLSAWHLWHGRAQVYFDTATMLIALLLAGRLIEAWLRRRALNAIIAMQAADDATALALDDTGVAKPVPSATIGIGRHVLVRAGAVAAVDGIIIDGDSRLDTAFLSGESMPRAVTVGDRISAGSLNLDRALLVRSDREPGDRDLDRMGGRIALELAARRPPADSQTRIAEILGRWILPSALSVGGITLALGLGVETALLRTLAILVAACPCALAIATPLADLQVAIRANRYGLRIADPSCLPALATAASIIFDKTGTLTCGTPRVVRALPADGWTEKRLLTIAASAEAGIEHPLAHAIIAAAPPGVDHQHDGRREARAATGHWRGRPVRVATAPTKIDGEDPSLTWLQVYVDETVIGHIGIDDGLERQAPEVIAHLRADRLHLQLASGDAAGPVQAVAAQVGIAPIHAHSSMTPTQKADLIRRTPGPVIFIGDGVNDAPAMATADCGISLAHAHPSAQASAAIGILEGGLHRLLDARRLAGWSQRLVRRNLYAALAYNLMILPLAAIGALTPLSAALAMCASSLTQIALVFGSRAPAPMMAEPDGLARIQPDAAQPPPIIGR